MSRTGKTRGKDPLSPGGPHDYPTPGGQISQLCNERSQTRLNHVLYEAAHGLWAQHGHEGGAAVVVDR